VNPLDIGLAEVLGQASAKALGGQLDLHTVGDLLRHYPRRYVERGTLSDIAEARIGEHVTLVAEVRSARKRPMRNRRGELLDVVISDGTRTLNCTFFNPRKLMRVLVPGQRALFAGKVGVYRNTRQLTHPQFEPLDPDDEVLPYFPVYPATAKLATWQIAKCVKQVLAVIDDPPDPLPAEIRAARGLPTLGAALRGIHRPSDLAAVRKAKDRLVWDEALAVQLALGVRRLSAAARPAPACPPRDGGLRDSFDARLPFTLTTGQREVGETIAADLAGEHPMNRLLQGDVGAGKTVVALRAMLQVVDGGRQAALLAPTEVLAAQHYRTLRELLGPLGTAGELGGAEQATRVTLLTGSMTAARSKQALLDVASGAAGIVVGTHALLQERVSFADLGLVVVDEQHRFGVEQRDALRRGTGGSGGELTPHLLVMTATPIPRTVAMTVYGDLEVSMLRELPAGRAAVATTVVPTGERPAWLARVWERLREEVEAGRQAYVVCPRIGGESTSDGAAPDAGDLDGTELADPDAALDPASDPVDGAGADPADPPERRPPLSVAQLAPMLADGPLAGLRLAVLHGRLPPEEKEALMRGFTAGEVDVLIATTVIEVGVDVPNATAMVIMEADRFGLSQLHQLRGRVGRGRQPGVCLLVTDQPEGSTGRDRLDAVAATTDGFQLARRDLELRREGDVLGESQSGRRSGLRLLSLLRDEKVITEARDQAMLLLDDDPELTRHRGLAGVVAEVVGSERAEFLEKV
jgi:ATP-dependent DNA helicase RecG